MTTEWEKDDRKPFDSGPDDASTDGMDVTEGEVGSAHLKDPAEVEEQGERPEDATLPETGLEVPPSEVPGQPQAISRG